LIFRGLGKFSQRIDRSSSMTAAAFGFSAAIDLAMSAAVVSGIPVDARAF
jgi:hypothetical protein